MNAPNPDRRVSDFEEILRRHGIELDKFQLADLEEDLSAWRLADHECEETS